METDVLTHVADMSVFNDDDVVAVEVGDLELALYHMDGEVFASDQMCTHGLASLADGLMLDGLIECPLHSGTFDVKTGKAVGAPCTEDLRTYKVSVEGTAILVALPANKV